MHQALYNGRDQGYSGTTLECEAVPWMISTMVLLLGGLARALGVTTDELP
jgi:hypothetical protein